MVGKKSGELLQVSSAHCLLALNRAWISGKLAGWEAEGLVIVATLVVEEMMVRFEV